MKRHRTIERLSAQAEHEHRYFFAKNDAQRRAMERRKNAGELTSPYKGIFVRTDFYATLKPRGKITYLIRTLATLHPKWTFAGASAAAIYGLPYKQGIDQDERVYIATQQSANQCHTRNLQHIHMHVIESTDRQGITVTTPQRTLVDCAILHPFEDTLGMFDFALATGLTTPEKIRHEYPSLRKSHVEKVESVLKYANPLSEN